MRRRSGDRMTRTNRTRKGAVGTVKKSIEAHCERCVRRNVAEGQDLRFELGARVEAGPNCRKEGREAWAHD